MRIFDITLIIYPGMPIYPGNPDVEFHAHQSIPEHTSNSTKVILGTHTGTHLDAPKHISNAGEPVDQVSLEALIGPCRVLDLSYVTDVVKVSHLQDYSIQSGQKILLKTNNSIRGWDTFYDDYVYLDGDAADYLAQVGVSLVGIDYFSIKQKGSKDFRPHDSLLKRNIPILEALKLTEIPEGEYLLSALPLPFEDLDGSPVRAVLISDL